MHVRMTAASDIGLVRKKNEDAVFYDEKLGLGIVCDGIGGREGGEVASNLACETMKNEIVQWHYKTEEPTAFLRMAIKKTNKALLAKAKEQPDLEGMGTTIECLLFHKGSLYIAHVGDSRTYLYFQKHFWQLTIDHNVQTLVAYGDLPTEMLKLSRASALVKALGISEDLEPDIYSIKTQPGELFITATDGLFNMVSDKKIANFVEKNINSGTNIVKTLIDQACQSGGIDNISVLVSQT